MGTRIEIYKDGEWQQLILSNKRAIKYNVVINKIGKISTREISHTNTFSLPDFHQNRKSLGLNTFNVRDLAKAMNTKYECKYYVEDKVIQEGYLVINNTNNGLINVNFIDGALNLIDTWGSIPFKEFLKSGSIDFPSDYATAISNLRNYSMPINSALTKLPSVGSRGYDFCKFPSNLNGLGEKFQKTSSDIREDDQFNQYQCRPIFNVKGLFDLAIESYGYTANYVNSNTWTRLANTYITNKAEGQGDASTTTIVNQTISISSHTYRLFVSGEGYLGSALFQFPSSNSVKPSELLNFTTPTSLDLSQYSTDWFEQNTIFVPRDSNGNSGKIRFTADWSGGDPNQNKDYIVTCIWQNATSGLGTVSLDLYAGNSFNDFENEYLSSDELQHVDITVSRSVIDTPPSGAGAFIGFMVSYTQRWQTPSECDLLNMVSEETYLPVGGTGFDDYGQYLGTSVDFSDNAPDKSLKKLISGIMHKEGILIDINTKTKVVKFFDYGYYEKQMNSGEYYDWSKYLLKGEKIKRDTNYGKQYAKKNRVGLSSPYLGNYTEVYLENQGTDSKYKDFTENYVKGFRDISDVIEVNNTNVPYLEFTNKELGLVEYDKQIGDGVDKLTARRIDPITGVDSTLTDIDSLAGIVNVNASILTEGVSLWYRLIDEAIKVKAKFLLPVDVIRNLDISKPVYIEELGGYYIIEEVSQYVNGSTPTFVNLIKLVHDLRGYVNEVGDGSAQIYISVESEVENPISGAPNKIITSSNFYNYVPSNSVSVVYTQLSDSVDNGGTPTGLVVTQNMSTINPYLNNINTLKDTNSSNTNDGWYKVQVKDVDNSIDSNVSYGFFGSTAITSPSASWSFNPFGGFGLSSGDARIGYSYSNFLVSITSSVLEYQQVDGTTSLPISGVTAKTVNFPTSPNGGNQVVTFLDGVGFYLITLTVNGSVVSDAQSSVEVV